MKKVLLVDDDALLRELLGLIVEKHGYDLLKAENGHDAMELVGSVQPDLIVLDIMSRWTRRLVRRGDGFTGWEP